jgi:hypothetical protein
MIGTVKALVISLIQAPPYSAFSRVTFLRRRSGTAVTKYSHLSPIRDPSSHGSDQNKMSLPLPGVICSEALKNADVQTSTVIGNFD